jgi:hypothetical protein
MQPSTADGLCDPFGLQRPLLTTWLRSSQAALQLTAASQQLLLERGRALADAMVAAQPGADSPIAGSQRVWRTLVESWAAAPFEAQQLVHDALTELRFSARELLGELEREQEAHRDTQAERDRARELGERERATRRQVEQERDAAAARAERLEAESRRSERSVRRLEGEVAEYRARLERVEHERDEQRQRADHERTERQRAEHERAEQQRLERSEAQQQSTGASAADKPAVKVVRREDDWAVVRDQAKRASGVFDTKREAVQRAREIARNEGVEVHVEPAARNGRG